MAASDGGDFYPLSPNNEDSSIPSSNNNVAPPSPPKGPVVCLVSSLCDGAGGGLLGSVFGLGQGLWKRQGFKVALKEAGTSAKTFAILSGVHTLVTCFLRTIRGKHDAINAGIAGCATGLVLGMPGTPDSLLRSCVTFGAFSYIIERFNKPQAALASDLDSSLVKRGRIGDYSPLFSLCVLPPFVLPPAYPGSIMPSHSKHFLEYTSRGV